MGGPSTVTAYPDQTVRLSISAVSDPFGDITGANVTVAYDGAQLSPQSASTCPPNDVCSDYLPPSPSLTVFSQPSIGATTIEPFIAANPICTILVHSPPDLYEVGTIDFQVIAPGSVSLDGTVDICLNPGILVSASATIDFECGDGIDNDGDGSTDLADTRCATTTDAHEGLHVSSSSKISDDHGFLSGPGNPGGLLDDIDQFGIGTAALGDFNGDGITDFAVGANKDDDGGTNRGAVYLLMMNADGTVAERHKISDTPGGLSGPGDLLADTDQFGITLTAIADLNGDGIGDLDGDGVTDLAVGANQDDTGGANRGAVYLLLMNADATVKSVSKIDDSDLPGVLEDGDRMGVGLAWLGDLDGPGGLPGVLAAGAPRGNDGGPDRGELHLLYLNPDGTLALHRKISATAGLGPGSLSDGDRFGHSVARLGDLDDDGTLEIAVGAASGKVFGGPQDSGAVWILSLATDGTVASAKKVFPDPTFPQETADVFGETVTSVGDLNGDGVEDLAVGASGDDDGGANRGAVWLLFLDSAGDVADQRKINRAQIGAAGGLDDGDGLGFVAAADIDGDGVTDLLAGAPFDDDGGTNSGAAYPLFLDGVPAICGNGALDPLEECDDGNTSNADACSNSCTLTGPAAVPAGTRWNHSVLALLLLGLAIVAMPRAPGKVVGP